MMYIKTNVWKWKYDWTDIISEEKIIIKTYLSTIVEHVWILIAIKKKKVIKYDSLEQTAEGNSSGAVKNIDNRCIFISVYISKGGREYSWGFLYILYIRNLQQKSLLENVHPAAQIYSALRSGNSPPLVYTKNHSTIRAQFQEIIKHAMII